MSDWVLAGLVISSILSSTGLLIIAALIYKNRNEPELPEPDWLDEFIDKDPGWNGKPPKMMKRTREWLYDDEEEDDEEEYKLH